MVGIARVQHTFKHKSGMPKDDIVNSFFFWSAAGVVDTASATFLADKVSDFYYGGDVGKTGHYIAHASLAIGCHQIKVYDMQQPEPRAPVFTRVMGDGARSAVAALPAEVSLCLSYRGAAVSGSNAARRRGRIYLGPLNTGIMEADSNGFARPTQPAREAIVNAGKALAIATSATGVGVTPWNWSVWSRAAQGGTNDLIEMDSLTVVKHFFVDNAFDTVRKRGATPTTRSEGTVP